MHGVKREKTSAQAKAARKAKEAARLEAYVAVEARFFELRDADDHSEAALEQTTKLLSLNPEFFSVWNYRRSILSHLFESTQADAEADADGDKHAARIALLQDDLELTMHALRAHPKVYWIWSHRTWCLDSLPDPKRDGSKWKKELKLVEHMLDLDPRNFHGWDYRRHLLVQLSLSLSSSSSSSSDPTPSLPATTTFPDILSTSLLKQELAYTLRKIESNFSNFSAWHQRSRVLPALWAREQADAKQRAQQRDEELELIRQAMYTDPSDSSIWIYHRWLVSGELEDADADAGGGAQGRGEPVLDREIAGIEELLEMEPDSKWCLDTVAHYKTLKRSRLLAGGGERSHDEQVGELTTGIRNLLARLQQVDPLRKARYQDWLEAL